MISVERPSEKGTPQWNGPQQWQLRFSLNTTEVDEYHEKGFLILRNVFQPEEIEIYRQYEHFRWYRTRPDRMPEAERTKYYFL